MHNYIVSWLSGGVIVILMVLTAQGVALAANILLCTVWIGSVIGLHLSIVVHEYDPLDSDSVEQIRTISTMPTPSILWMLSTIFFCVAMGWWVTAIVDFLGSCCLLNGYHRAVKITQEP